MAIVISSMQRGDGGGDRADPHPVDRNLTYLRHSHAFALGR
jgi:hypothetical protein